MELNSITVNSAISPCTLGDCIHRKNVVSKSYAAPEAQMQKTIEDFITAIAAAELENTSLPFFIMEPLENNWIKLKIHISVEHCYPKLPMDLHFDSYFSIDNMASLCVSKEPEKHMSEAYEQLFNYLHENSLQAITPVFQVLGGDKNIQYTFLKVGYIQS